MPSEQPWNEGSASRDWGEPVGSPKAGSGCSPSVAAGMTRARVSQGKQAVILELTSQDDHIKIGMKPEDARTLGDALFRCGCDVDQAKDRS